MTLRNCEGRSLTESQGCVCSGLHEKAWQRFSGKTLRSQTSFDRFKSDPVSWDTELGRMIVTKEAGNGDEAEKPATPPEPSSPSNEVELPERWSVQRRERQAGSEAIHLSRNAQRLVTKRASEQPLVRSRTAPHTTTTKERWLLVSGEGFSMRTLPSPAPCQSRAKTRMALAGIVSATEHGNPWRPGPVALILPPFPATSGFTQWSYTPLLKTSRQVPPDGKPISYSYFVAFARLATTTTSPPTSGIHR